MNCCQCQGIEAVFDPKHAAKELENYRKKGPANTTRMLIDALISRGVEEMTLLDIGGGVGAIQHALLRAGMTTAVGVDASPAYLEAAKEEAERQGFADRVTSHAGDFVDLAPEIPPADVVTLDRVICCYHDMEALVGLSSERARRLYGLVFPRDEWWVRMAGPIANLFFRLRRNPFRVFLHPTEAVDAVLRGNGLVQRFCGKTLVWQVMVYQRVAVSAD
jgi:magnesium-protoporphyrin O-methyltransferase